MYSIADIKAILAETCHIESDSWSEESTVIELGINSLSLAALIAHCEDRLSLDLNDESIMRIMAARTVGQIVQEMQALQPRGQAIPT
jgi:acyl carrier protein